MQGLARLIAFLLAVLSACPVWARGGGGCLAEGTRIATPAGAAAVEGLKAGDTVWSVVSGNLKPARVEAATKIEVDRYLEISAGAATLRVTPEHPLMVAPGEYRIAGEVRPGDRVYVNRGAQLNEERVRTASATNGGGPAYNLLVNPGGTYISEGIAVHNKGCFLPDSLILKADGEEIPISLASPGDEVLAFTSEGRIVRTVVRNVLRTEVDEHLIVETDRETLRVTPEHPFFVGRGTFKTIEALKVGDELIAWDGQTLGRQRILSLERVPGRIEVYNLQTDQPHTFFVGRIAVHNKGGGGGCFPPGTRISVPGGDVPIESLAPGDEIVAVTAEGARTVAGVKALLVARNSLLRVQTRNGIVELSPEHPLREWNGDFRPAGELRRGDRISRWDGQKLVADRVCGVSPSSGETLVFNLQVEGPHTFLAGGYPAHNKGGSSGGFRSSSSSRSSSSGGGSPATFQDFVIFFSFIGIFLVAFITIWIKVGKSKSENLDHTYSESQIAKKAGKTEKLLQFLARQDPAVAPEELRKLAEATFRKLQECWEKREYGPMNPLMMTSLYNEHLAQLRGLVQNHEINRIENVQVKKVDLVNARYTHKEHQREFTALISASATDFYVDDRTGAFIRGDKSPADFQEFWTFQFTENRWLLREIEQAGESDYLKDENFVETLTEDNVQKIYADAAKDGVAGPWIEKGVETKATKIERLLNFLAQTDKLWDRGQMLERARQVFMAVYLAREAGKPEGAPTGDLYPEVAENLAEQLRQWRTEDMHVEYRNLCVRKVELILVRNYQDRAMDEFTVRISAHAQKVVRKGDRKVSEDKYVTPFEDFWTFGRLDEKWKLKELLPPAQGKKRIGEENIDEDAGSGQLEWYYRQKRAN